METFELILIMASAVLASSIIDQVLPRISPPLIQIGLGLVLAFVVATPINITLEPELFLVLFIAPLLFHDARNADKVGLWKNKVGIVSLAVGLVLAIVLIVGFTMHWIVPSLSLTATFILGAALGPTDAVAVESLGRSSNLKPREKSMLQGEALINDASGVVSFQFAVSAAITGTFSLIDATASFILSFFGGIAIGLVLAYVINWLRQKIHDAGIESTTFHVLLDVMMPFIIFLVAELVHVSGILAVVAAGLLISSLEKRNVGPVNAKLSIVSSSVWKVLAFTLNGIVFVMLGMQLPDAMNSLILDDSISNGILVLWVLALTLVITVARFIWIILMNIYTAKKELKQMAVAQENNDTANTTAANLNAQRPEVSKAGILKTTLTSTIGGPKGAITLSIIMSVPVLLSNGEPFPQRDLIIFLASGTILCTLILTNFLLPVLAPKVKDNQKALPESEAKIASETIAILRKVIADLTAARTQENKTATRAVISSYNARIAKIRERSDIASTDYVIKLRLQVLNHQQQRLREIREEKTENNVDIFNCMFYITRHQMMLHEDNRLKLVGITIKHLPTVIKVLFGNIKRMLDVITGRHKVPTDQSLRIKLEECSVQYLQELLDSKQSDIPEPIIREQLSIHQVLLQNLKAARTTSLTALTRSGAKVREVQRYAYHVELEEVTNSLKEGRISRGTAKRLRDNVYLMLVDLDDEI